MDIQKADPFGENNYIKLIVNNNISNRNIEPCFYWFSLAHFYFSCPECTNGII